MTTVSLDKLGYQIYVRGFGALPDALPTIVVIDELIKTTPMTLFCFIPE